RPPPPAGHRGVLARRLRASLIPAMHERDHARELGAVRSGLAATALLCVVELVGGYLTNSLALMTDAAHMFTDMAALGLTLFALWICSRPASETKTFGYYRAEIRSEERRVGKQGR